MTIHVKWGNNDKTILIWVFEAAWDWDEFYASQEKSTAMLETVSSHIVDVIADMRHTRSLPSDMLSRYRQSRQFIAANEGRTVIVANLLVKTLAITYNSIFSRSADKLLVADTLEEAYSLLIPIRQERDLRASSAPDNGTTV